MTYEDITPADSISDSLSKIKARDDALRTGEFSGTAPVSPAPFQIWIDTVTRNIYRRNEANIGWIPIGRIDDPHFGLLATSGPSAMLGTLDHGGFRGINAADPTASQDLVTRNYFDLNSPSRFRFSAGGHRSNVLGLTSMMEWNNVTDNIGFSLGNNFTELTVSNSGKYTVAFHGLKAFTAGATPTLERILPAVASLVAGFSNSPNTNTPISFIRTVALVAGDVIRVRDTSGNQMNATNNLLHSIMIDYKGP